MSRRLWVFLAFLTPCMAASAQRPTTGALVGRVLDARTGAPISNAELNFSRQREFTDSTGAYRFSEAPPGVHVIVVRRLGYELLNQNISIIIGAESETDFRLNRVVRLDTVESKATSTYISPSLREFEDRRKAGVGHFIDEATLRKNDNSTLGNTLKRIPGIRVSVYNSSEYVASGRTPGGGQAGALMGGAAPRADPMRRDSPRGCWVAVYLDGLMIYNGDPKQQAPDLAKILVKDLGAVEFYSGTASLPVQFSSIKHSDCGVLLLWTRER